MTNESFIVEFLPEKTVRVLVAGEFSYGSLGRHTLSFVATLSQYPFVEIYLDVIVGGHAEKLYQQTLQKKNVKKASELNFNHVYDFAFYTCGLPCYQPFCQYKLLNFTNRKAKVKGCYCVFDGTIPPLHWIDFINNNFDICLAPSRFIAKTLQHYGVDICCMGLHCVVFNEQYIAHQRDSKPPNKKFKFGFVGMIDSKKDAPLAIRAFTDEFSNTDNVEFHLHLTYVHDEKMKFEMAESLENAQRQAASITVTRGHIPQEQLDEIFLSFDAYLFPQKITGYFTTICEALSVGIPVITSEIPPLKEIQDYIDPQNHIYWVKAKDFAPAFHSFLHYMSLGASFKSRQGDLQKAMRDMFEARDVLGQQHYVEERKKAMKSLSGAELAKTWVHLVYPKRICITDDSYHDIYDDIFFMSDDLFKKYKQIFGENNFTTTDGKERRRQEDAQSHWYLNLPEYKVIEEFSSYHQDLVLSQIKPQKNIDTNFATPEHELMTATRKLIIALIASKHIPLLIVKILLSRKRINTVLRKISSRSRFYRLICRLISKLLIIPKKIKNWK